MESPLDLIFVYGTLRHKGVFPISELLENRVQFLGLATIPGKIYLVDYYPGLITKNPGSSVVYGEIYQLQNISDFDIIDEYEGISMSTFSNDLFKRVVVNAKLQKGNSLPCWVYIYNREIKNNMKIIESGDYLLLND